MKKMMLKVMVLAMVMLFMAPALFLQNAGATGWATCTVDKVGPGGTGTAVYIYLTDTGTHWTGSRYFVLTPTRAKEMLATALTALSLGKSVNVGLEGWTQGSTVSTLYILN